MRAVFALGLTLFLVGNVWASDVTIEAPHSHPNRGVSITQWLTDATNRFEVAGTTEPFYITSFHFEYEGTQTVSVSIARLYAYESQIVGEVVTTNIFGKVETNVSYQVTNTAYKTIEIPVLGATTFTNSHTAAITTVVMAKPSDVIKYYLTSTNGTAAVTSGKR